MARKIEVIEAKDSKAFKNKVNQFYSRDDIVINRAIYRPESNKFMAVIEYERSLKH